MRPNTLTAVVNQSLAEIGEVQITNIEDDTSPSRVINSVLGQTIEEAQNLIDWSELHVRITPSLEYIHDDTGEYYYHVPTNFVQVLMVNDIDDPLAETWRYEQQRLITNGEVESLIYKRYTEEVTEWSPDLRELTYLLLAHKISMLLTQNENIAQMTLAKFEMRKSAIQARAKNRARDRDEVRRFYKSNRLRTSRGGGSRRRGIFL